MFGQHTESDIIEKLLKGYNYNDLMLEFHLSAQSLLKLAATAQKMVNNNTTLTNQPPKILKPELRKL